MEGWIKLHRRVMESDTFSKLNAIQQIITIYIILNANHEDGIWYDKYKDIEVKVKRGQLITSRKKIADEWFKGDKEVTEQKIRTTLKKLEKLKFITITSTNNYTLIEVLNYNVYQKKEKEANQVVNQEETKSQPSNNQEKTTNKNVKNDKNVKEVYIHWNSEGVIKHRELTATMASHINARLNSYSVDELNEAISNYATVVKSDEYFFSYKWSLQDFMNPKNLVKFMSDAQPFENYKSNKSAPQRKAIPDRKEFNLDD